MDRRRETAWSSWPRLLAVPLLLAALLLGGVAHRSGADELSGVYDAKGRYPNGKDYQGEVQIKDLGTLHAVLWRLADGEAYKGIAIHLDDVLGGAYGPADARFGLAVYRIRGGRLEGVWADSQDLKSALGRETLEGPPELNGKYRITLGQNRDGVTNYGGEVAIQRRGETYLVLWPTKPPSLGVGIRVGDLLVVAFGTNPKKLPGVVAYRARPGEALDGIWATVGQKTLGSETLTRHAQ